MPGLNNIGLLITTFGRVIWSDPTGFYIDDGSGYDNFSAVGPGDPPGLKVSIPLGVTPPAAGSYAAVTGISSVYNSDIGLCRLLRARQQSDIEVL